MLACKLKHGRLVLAKLIKIPQEAFLPGNSESFSYKVSLECGASYVWCYVTSFVTVLHIVAQDQSSRV